MFLWTLATPLSRVGPGYGSVMVQLEISPVEMADELLKFILK